MAQKNGTFTLLSVSGIALIWLLRLHESYENDRTALYLLSENNFMHKKLHITQKLTPKIQRKRKLKAYVITAWKFNS